MIIILGNHEFYKGFDLVVLKDKPRKLIRESVTWYYNEPIVIGYNNFICITLWLHIPKKNERVF